MSSWSFSQKDYNIFASPSNPSIGDKENLADHQALVTLGPASSALSQDMTFLANIVVSLSTNKNAHINRERIVYQSIGLLNFSASAIERHLIAIITVIQTTLHPGNRRRTGSRLFFNLVISEIFH